MTTPTWNVSGQYYETCSCDFVCPCILQQMAVEPSKGTCTFAMGFKIETGKFESISLDGLGFIVIGRTPEAMINGNWSVGLIIDERASAEQRDAITAIASGGAGGPMAGISGLVGKFLGAERAAITFDADGPRWSVKAEKLVDMTARHAMGLNPDAAEPLHLTNTGHPASDDVTLDRAVSSHVSVFGLTWDDASGKNSGQHSPFSWRSA